MMVENEVYENLFDQLIANNSDAQLALQPTF